MAQKNATPTKEQKAVITKHNLPVAFWVVVKDLPHSLIIKHRATGEFRVIEKHIKKTERRNEHEKQQI